MTRSLLVLCVVGACGQPEPPLRSPQQRAVDSAAAVTALQGSKFDEAGRQAVTALSLDPRNSRAAAVRAIATYQAAGEKLWTEIEEISRQGGGLDFLDHERGRAAWEGFAASLEAVDRDLAVAAKDPEFSLELCLACWEHDWNHNGRIDDRDRKLFEIEYDGKDGELAEGDPRRRPTFRFDVGDVDWARAMISFQRAGVELVLAYKWTELDKFKLFGREPDQIVIHLADAGRVRHARELVLAGLEYSDRSRAEYLAETDDDREWVPNPHQKNHPMPLEVDPQLFETWAGVTGDVRRMLDSEEGLSLRELAAVIDKHDSAKFPDGYIDLGRMFREPKDIVILPTRDESPENLEKVFRGLFGNGYQTGMRGSPLVGRLKRMHDELDGGHDTFERKLRYLLWLN